MLLAVLELFNFPDVNFTHRHALGGARDVTDFAAAWIAYESFTAAGDFGDVLSTEVVDDLVERVFRENQVR